MRRYILIFCRNIISAFNDIITMNKKLMIPFSLLLSIIICVSFHAKQEWQSKFVQVDKNGSLNYTPDEQGNIIPDFSRVGYYGGDQDIPHVAIVKTIYPSTNAQSDIQAAIDEVAKKTPDKNGFRGTIFLKKGTYRIPGSIRVSTSGIVLRGEGDTENGTRLIATAKTQDPLLSVSGTGGISEIKNSREKITDEYVPVGSFSFSVTDAKSFQKGDRIIVYRPGTDAWVHALKMDQIVERKGTKQWKAEEYNFTFERAVTKIEGNKIFIDNPIVMPMESKYGGGEIFKYNFDGRIFNVGIEQIY